VPESLPYATRFQANNFGCLRSVDLALTRLHAFIGPNDSGKSTILRGVGVVMNAVAALGENPVVSAGSEARLAPGFSLLLATSNDLEAKISRADDRLFSREVGPPPPAMPWIQDRVPNLYDKKVGAFPGSNPPVDWRKRLVRGARLVRLDPDQMRSPSTILPDDGGLGFITDRGLGLAAIYDRIRDRDNDAFGAIEKDVRRLFPSVKKVGFDVPAQGQKSLRFELVDGTIVPAESISEGLLYYLGFAAIPHLASVSALLVEEPENGLHPARIKEVVRILREISKTTQVLVATHSPLVVNELNDEEVTVVTRNAEAGTQATPIRESPSFAARSKVYALGELWLSYADGETEAALLSKSTP
jgi:energy-coupling factor transporter ATP-binding protein EcfA2